jgi:hypothetical protein
LASPDFDSGAITPRLIRWCLRKYRAHALSQYRRGHAGIDRDPRTIKEAAVTDIQISVNDQTFTAQLADNPTARDLSDQLPLTLRFRDFNRVEKIAKLPRPLTMEGVPAGDDPEVDDIGYYAPSGDLVLYYGDVGYWNGIVRIGRLDAEDMSLIERQPDGFELTIDRA